MFSEQKEIYEFGQFRLDVTERLLTRLSGRRVRVSQKAFETLCVLVRNSGHLLSKEEFLNQVWADSFVEENNLDKCIHAIRRALGEKPGEPKFIETVRKHGYRFVAEVRRVEIEEEEKRREGEEEKKSGLSGETSSHLHLFTSSQKAPPSGKVVALTDWRHETKEEKSEETALLESNEQISIPKLKLTPTQTPQKIRPIRRVFVLAGLIGLIVLTGLIYGIFRFNGERKKTLMVFNPASVKRLTSAGRVTTAAISPDGKFIIYAQEETDGRQSLWMHHIESASNAQIGAPNGIEYLSLNITPDSNSIYYSDQKGTIYQIPVLNGTPKKITSDLFKDSRISFSPDGRQFTFVRRFEKDASALFIINADGSGERELVSFEQPWRLESDPAWSPDGEIIACPIIIDGFFRILAVRVADGNFELFSAKKWSLIKKLAWLPDSKNLIFIGTETANFHQLFQISYPEGEANQITSDLNNYNDFSLTADGRSLATVRVEQTAHLWTAAGGEAARARQLTSGFEKFDGIYSLEWISENKLLYTSSPSDVISVWTIETDGDSPKLLIKDAHFPTVSPDSRFIVYRKRIDSEMMLLEMNLSDGGESVLTKGTITYPAFSPDGKWLVFTKYDGGVALWKIPFEGGEETRILAENVVCSAVSPDGKMIAFVFKKGGQPNKIALVSSDGGEIIKKFDAALETNPLSNNQNLQWTPDGRAIYFIALMGGVSNIWKQPIDGGAPVQVTDFETGRIFNFAFSPDGKQLALSRGALNSDVVLIKNSGE